MIRPTRLFRGLLVIVAVALLGWLWSHSAVFTRVIYLVAAVIIVSWLISFFVFKGLKVNRYSRGSKGELGQVFEEVYELDNAGRFGKIWLEVEDESRLPGSGGKKVISALKGNTSRHFSSYTLLSQRGQFKLGPTRVVGGDPLGIFQVSKTFDHDRSLIVLPHLVELNRFHGPHGLMQGGRVSRRKTPEWVPPSVTGLREYAPGDALNRIHWPTTARRDRLMVKEFEHDPLSDVWLIVDAQQAANIATHDEKADSLATIPLWWLQKNVYQLPQDSFEYVATLTGSIARYYTQRDQILGLITIGQKRLLIPADRGERQLTKILETLAYLNPAGRVPISGVIESHLKFIQRGSSVVIITPTVHLALMNSMASLLRQAISPLVILLEVESFGGKQHNLNLYSTLQAWKIPTVLIRYGDDLIEKLEKQLPRN